MLCPNCQQEFNANTNLPRILVFCGHTYCHTCIESSLVKDSSDSQKWSLNCFECGTLNQVTDGVNSFPKNLVLLQVQNSQPSTTVQQKQQVPIETKSKEVTKPQAQTSQNSLKIVCQEHNKKLEAFCEKDLQVLCIDCILSEQHKSHEIVSVQKAAEKQKQSMYDEVSSAQKVEEKLRFIHSDIKRHIGEMQSQAEKNRRELSQIFNNIRELILEREQTLKRQISENLTREELECQNKLQEISDFIGSISKLKQEMVTQSQEQELEILQKSKQRIALTQEVNGVKSKELMNFSLSLFSSQCQSLVEIKRDQEMATISKIINPNFKGSIPNHLQGGNQGVGSTLYSHTASTANKKKHGQQLNSVQNGGNVFPQLATQTSLHNIEQKQTNMTKDQMPFEQPASKKQGKMNNQLVKNKQSPNRQPPNFKKQDSKKSNNNGGIVVLDQQNKQSKQQKTNLQKQNSSNNNNSGNNGSGGQGCGGNQQIVLMNLNPYGNQHHLNENQDEVIDDVSSIYPLETNECYYNYSPKNTNANAQGQCAMNKQITTNLNDLLECLNKSEGNLATPVPDQEIIQKDNSTASDTVGSEGANKDQNIKKIQNKSNETPKQKINQWNTKNTNNAKNILKKENSTGDFEEFKNLQIKIQSPYKQIIVNSNSSAYNEISEAKGNGVHRSGSLQRFQTSNGLRQLVNTTDDQDEGMNNKFERSHSKNDGSLRKTNCLQNLSQERKLRKMQKMVSSETSPTKQEQNNIKLNGNGQDLMQMLKDCTSNIEKIEFKPSAKKGLIQSTNLDTIVENPVKQVATICLVDLTLQNIDQQPLRIQNKDKKDSMEIDTQSVSKHSPNVLKARNSSPFGEKHFSQFTKSENIIDDIQEENKSPINASKSPTKGVNQGDSPSKFQIQFTHDDSLNKNSDLRTFQGSSHYPQPTQQFGSTVSVDTSIADPFRALCRMKEEFIFVFSGFNDNKLISCEAFDVQRGVWKEISQIGKARTKFSAVPISKSRILIFGGKQADGQRTGEIEEYNLKTNKFKMLPFKMPKPRSGFAACVKRDEGKIFFCGGNSGSVLRKFDCLDLKKGKWSRLQEMIQKRDELAVALGPDGKIYAIGGYGGGSSSNNTNNPTQEGNQEIGKQPQSNCLKTAERFDFQTGQWEMLPEMNEARRALAAVALPDGIYAIGGYDGKQYLSSVEKFDLQKQEWVHVKSMNTSRCTLAAVASSDCQYIYALGGFNGNSLDLVERYNIMSDEWEFTTPMNTKRFMHEAVNLVTH